MKLKSLSSCKGIGNKEQIIFLIIYKPIEVIYVTYRKMYIWS